MSYTFVGFHRGDQYSKWLRSSDLYSVNITPVLREWKSLNTHAAIFLALSQLDRICDVQDESLVDCIGFDFIERELTHL